MHWEILFNTSKFQYKPSITVAGDDLDDIAIGAPLYANLAQDLIEIGRVSVYYQKVTAGRHTFPNSGSDTIIG